MTSQPHHVDSTPGAGDVPAELAQIRGVVRGLTDTLWAARTTNELMDTITEIEALKSTLDGLELGVVRELDATNAVKTTGWASTQDFLTTICRRSQRHGSRDRAPGRRGRPATPGARP